MEVRQMGSDLDKRSFILGMVTAFSECVANGCKRLALSPPLTKEDYPAVERQANEIIEKHGLLHYHEQNLDLPEENRVEWILIAGRQETIDAYLALREQGHSPIPPRDYILGCATQPNTNLSPDHA